MSDDLAAARRIERRLLELHLEEAVPEIGVGRDRGEHLRALVADEVGTRRVREPHLDLHLARLTGDLAMLLHQLRVLLVVHAETALARELLRQLDREAVGRLEREGVVAGYLAARGGLLEELHAALERLGEARLFGREDLPDLVGVLDELG